MERMERYNKNLPRNKTSIKWKFKSCQRNKRKGYWKNIQGQEKRARKKESKFNKWI